MEYELRRRLRSQTLRLSVRPDARVVVTAPYFVRASSIERFVKKHTDWIERHIARQKKRTVLPVRRVDIPQLKKRALALASARCAHFAHQFGVSYRKISVRAQKSRWGSCSRAGNLSFNYKIAALPAHVADYVVVHEVCHLREMNHGKAFWALVEKAVPHYKTIRKELRNIAFSFE